MGESGKKIFGSHYYEGHGLDYKDVTYKVTLHFKTYTEYNDFLNWWVLGEDYRSKGSPSKSLKEDNP